MLPGASLLFLRFAALATKLSPASLPVRFPGSEVTVAIETFVWCHYYFAITLDSIYYNTIGSALLATFSLYYTAPKPSELTVELEVSALTNLL